MMRLDRFLSSQGFGTRKEVKSLIKKGIVKVNQEIIKSDNHKIDALNDTVLVGQKVIDYKKYIYLMLHKPKGYISARNDKNHKTVLDLIPKYEHYKLSPVGRLDKDTEGLMLLTNDGKLIHQLLAPNKKVGKKYYVELLKELKLSDKEKLENRIVIDGNYQCLPAIVELIDLKSCYITIYEGKFHQIKKMFQAVKNQVLYLKRLEMNGLVLDSDLKLKEYRELTSQELVLLKQISTNN
jgi:pseudouridine synthase